MCFYVVWVCVGVGVWYGVGVMGKGAGLVTSSERGTQKRIENLLFLGSFPDTCCVV